MWRRGRQTTSPSQGIFNYYEIKMFDKGRAWQRTERKDMETYRRQRRPQALLAKHFWSPFSHLSVDGSEHYSHKVSALSPHTSHLTPHTSHLTPHTSHLTPHTSHLTPAWEHARLKILWRLENLWRRTTTSSHCSNDV
jgi:hypothetical protein